MLRWHAGAAYGFFASTLSFGALGRATVAEHSAGLSLDLRLGRRWSLAASAGALLGGGLVEASGEGAAHRVLGGAFAALSASVQVNQPWSWAPFFLITVEVSASHARTAPATTGPGAGLTALDVRLGVLAGKTFADAVTPYVAARVFGGPVWWRGETGTDIHHYQIAAGVTVAIGRADVHVELAPFGERRFVAGAGARF